MTVFISSYPLTKIRNIIAGSSYFVLMRLSLFLFFIGLVFFDVIAQENQGISNSNYSPSSSVLLNPASIADSRTWKELNVAGVSFFALNDHEMLPGDQLSFTNFPENQEDLEYLGPKFAKMDLAIEGPAFFMVDGINTYGVSIRHKVQLDMDGMPDHLAHFVHNRFNHFPQYNILYNISNMKFDLARWTEVNFSLGHILYTHAKTQMNAGVTLKTLWGANHLGFKIDYMDYIVHNPFDLEMFNFKGEYAVGPSQGGYNGMAFDLGFTYKKLRRNARQHIPHTPRNRCAVLHYQYKLGFALLDLGSARFRNQSVHSSLSEVYADWPDFSLFDPQSFAEIAPELSEVFDDDLSRVYKEQKHKVGLPTAFVTQFDYHISKNFYGTFNWIHGFNRSMGFGLTRSSSLSFMPRYETERFEFSIPFTLSDYQYPQFGLALRAKYIVFGMEKLESFFNNKNMYGFDFYFNIKVPIYRIKTCRTGNGRFAAVPCWNGKPKR